MPLHCAWRSPPAPDMSNAGHSLQSCCHLRVCQHTFWPITPRRGPNPPPPFRKQGRRELTAAETPDVATNIKATRRTVSAIAGLLKRLSINSRYSGALMPSRWNAGRISSFCIFENSALISGVSIVWAMDWSQQFTDIGDDLMPAVQDSYLPRFMVMDIVKNSTRQDPSPAGRTIILDDPLPEILVRDRRGVAKAKRCNRESCSSAGPVAGTMQSTIELGKEQLASIQSARSGSPRRASPSDGCFRIVPLAWRLSQHRQSPDRRRYRAAGEARQPWRQTRCAARPGFRHHGKCQDGTGRGRLMPRQ